MRTKNRAGLMLPTLALLFGVVGETKAGFIYSQDWSSLTGTFNVSDYSQIGSGYYAFADATNLAALGWTATNLPQVDAWVTTSGPYNGVKGVLLNELNAPPRAEISTTITGLTANQVYTLSFNYWGDNEAGSAYSFAYTINGQSNTVNGTDTAPVVDPYRVTYQFTASGSSTTLSFVEETPSGSFASPIIGAITLATADDAATAAAPEPATIAMLGIGVVSLAGYRLRRRKAGAAG
jgi:hypothetical protein